MRKSWMAIFFVVLACIFTFSGCFWSEVKGKWINVDLDTFTNVFENDFFKIRYPDGVEVFDDSIYKDNSRIYSNEIQIVNNYRYCSVGVYLSENAKENKILNDKGNNDYSRVGGTQSRSGHFDKTISGKRAFWNEVTDGGSGITFDVYIPMNGAVISIFGAETEDSETLLPDHKDLAL